VVAEVDDVTKPIAEQFVAGQQSPETVGRSVESSLIIK
jgi:hypothetical protein